MRELRNALQYAFVIGEDSELQEADLPPEFGEEAAAEDQEPGDPADLPGVLAAATPAPYAAYLRHGEVAILSSSPECFLTLDTHGGLTTRPIKGSARRAEDVVWRRSKLGLRLSAEEIAALDAFGKQFA